MEVVYMCRTKQANLVTFNVEISERGGVELKFRTGHHIPTSRKLLMQSIRFLSFLGVSLVGGGGRREELVDSGNQQLNACFNLMLMEEKPSLLEPIQRLARFRPQFWLK
ncbi:hypothetical protein OUZ56_028652 [Daphnia magna]|uniref:Uncharacterized protein n=1 Tax=Daphnia magna TaxID=35525 RepID=A0ABR0B4J0_9CRUS|nr:hypothetical protein OUZ56_028652 [Daphnia magna]